MKCNLTMFVAAFAAALMVSAAGWSVLQPSMAAPVAPAAADQKLGMAMLAALVNADGTLASGSGVVSTERIGPGQYKVTFDRSVAGCVGSATPAYSSPIQALTAQLDTLGAYAVVLTRDSATATFVDRVVHLIVFCSK